jgi:hypothetical protein
VIVRPAGDRLHLITQPDHAHLARTIMARCAPLAGRPRRSAILHAIGEHDNGWTEEDAAPVADPATGALMDFVSAPLAVRHRVWPRAVSRLASDPWAAALVAQHAITVYDRYRSDSAWDRFFSEMEALRAAMLRRSGLPIEDLAEDYVFVRLGDLISLTFCTGWSEEQRFGEWRVHASADAVVVTPDAFAGSAISMEIAAREIRNMPFASNAALQAAVGAAPVTTLRGTVSHSS